MRLSSTISLAAALLGPSASALPAGWEGTLTDELQSIATAEAKKWNCSFSISFRNGEGHADAAGGVVDEERGTAAVIGDAYVWGSITDEESAAMEGTFDVVIASDVLWVLGSWPPLAAAARQMLAPGGDFLLAETGHDQLPLPAALAGFRTVAESSGLIIDDARTVPLPLQVDGYDAQLIVAHKDPKWMRR